MSKPVKTTVTDIVSEPPQAVAPLVMVVDIGKGINLRVEIERLPAVALQHVIYLGLRNILMDSHAAITAETNPDDRQNASLAMAERKLAALMAGEVRVMRGREGDPVKAEMKALATKFLLEAIKAAGKKRKDYKDEDFAKAVAHRLEKYDVALREQAEKVIASRKVTPTVDTNLADLGL